MNFDVISCAADSPDPPDRDASSSDTPPALAVHSVHLVKSPPRMPLAPTALVGAYARAFIVQPSLVVSARSSRDSSIDRRRVLSARAHAAHALAITSTPLA